jgi:hypothetical protein
LALQRSPADARAGPGGEAAAPPIVHEVLRSPGQPLDAATRAYMEPRFGHDFSRVRVHTGAQAAQSARAVHAQAYTVGQEIVFGSEQYAPGTGRGRWLLAHELAHVIQQGQIGQPAALQPRLAVSRHPDAAEREADAVAERVAAGANAQVKQGSPPALQRAWSWAGAGIGALGGVAAGALIGGLVGGGIGALIGAGIGLLAGGLIGGLVGGGREEESQAEVIEPTGPNDCRLSHHRKIAPAVTQALAWLSSAIARLDAFLAAPNADATRGVRLALQRHFSSVEARVATHIRGRLDQIRTDVQSRVGLRVECHSESDSSCSTAAAYVQGNGLMVFCPGFFNGSDESRTETLIHEMAHALVGGEEITDRGYQHDRVYPVLSTAEALTNAESYGLLVREVATGTAPATGGPADEQQDCPAAWQTSLRVAVARAQRWNRNALTATNDRRPNWLAGWTDLQNQHLGAATPAALDSARDVYRRMADRFSSSITFECEPEGGGRCEGGNLTYWYARGDLHICPAWPAQASEEDRILTLLIGLYRYAGGVDDAARAASLARLARDLTNRFWAAPALQTVLGP